MQIDLTNVLGFDVETTGLPPKGAHYENDFEVFPHVVSFAWIMNGIEKHYIIKPIGYTIPQDSTDIHGITHDYAVAKGVPFEGVVKEFIDDCLKADVIVAHNIYFDSSVIKANIMRMSDRPFYDELAEPAMHKDKRIDTMMKCIKFVNAPYPDGKRFGKWPSLKELHFKIFEKDFDAHDALEDVRAMMRCLPELVKEGIVELKRRDPKPDLKVSPIEFEDPQPVTTPVNVSEDPKPKKKITGKASKAKFELAPEPDPVPAKESGSANSLLSTDLDDF